MTGYSALDRLFHRIVLPSPAIGEMLDDLDKALASAEDGVPNRPVYVTGLARAGTTTLMRALHRSGAFASLTYADMPVVMAPLLWARLSRRFAKVRVAGERAHSDGVLVDFDSPEALEEVFWRTHCGGDYIGREGLVPHVPDQDVLAAYRGYLSRICQRYGKSRYLAKNNNLMLRLEAVRTAMPDATILIAVRDPLAQARSLLGQHLRFADADAFTRSYMTWLVHHEFGPDARPYLLPGQPVATGDRAGIDHWLTLWVACYGWLLEHVSAQPGGYRVVVYEQLCTDPSVWEGVARACGVDPGGDPGFRASGASPGAGAADPALVARAREIYGALAAAAG